MVLGAIYPLRLSKRLSPIDPMLLHVEQLTFQILMFYHTVLA